MVGFSFAPRGWALCAGQLLPIASNSALFALLGTTYGGDGQNTFGLPDYRGRGAVGMGNGPNLTPITQGAKSGAESVSLTTAQLPIHAPTVEVSVAIPAVSASTNVTAAPTVTSILGPVTGSGRPGTLYSTDATNVTLKPFSAAVTVGTIGSGAVVPIRDPFLGTNFIIALEGVFPSRN